MPRFPIALALLLLAAGLHAASEAEARYRPQLEDCPPRHQVSMNGLWEAAMVTQGWPLPEAPPRSGWIAGMPVPSDYRWAEWNHQLPGGEWHRAEHCWYRTTVYLPASLRGRDVGIRFGAVGVLARVWINGEFAGEHLGGFLPFRIALDEHARWDADNEIVVLAAGKAANVQRDEQGEPLQPKSGHLNSGWLITPSGNSTSALGIWQDVVLDVRPRTHVDAVRITTSVERGELGLRAAVAGETDGLTLHLAAERDGAVVQDFASEDLAGGTIDLVRPWADPALWSPADPVLHHLVLTLKRGDEVLDQHRVRFGFRELTVHGTKVHLNGRPFRLIGTDQSYGYHCDWDQTAAYKARKLHLVRAAGFNFLRGHRWPLPTDIIERCDELGLLVEQEAPLFNNNAASSHTERFRTNACEVIRGLIARDYNHPSVIIWSVENEHVTGAGATREHMMEYHMAAVEADPTRLVVNEGDWDLGGRATTCTPHYTLDPLDVYDTTTESRATWDSTERWNGEVPYLSGENANDRGFPRAESTLDQFYVVPEGVPFDRSRNHGPNPAEVARYAEATERVVRNFYLEGEMFGFNMFAWIGHATQPIPWPEEVTYDDWTALGGSKPRYLGRWARWPSAWTLRFDPTRPPAESYRTTAVFDATRHNLAPILTFWRDTMPTGFAGGERRDELHVINESFRDAELRVTWGLRRPGGEWVGEPQRKSLSLQTGDQHVIEAVVPLPAVAQRSAFELVSQVHEGDELRHERVRPLAVLPRADLSGIDGVALYDPAGILAPLTGLGLEARRVDDLGAIGEAAVLVLAPDALVPGSVSQDALQALNAWCHAGGRVLQLAQSKPSGWLPYPLRTDEQRVFRAELRRGGQDVLGEIQVADLAEWGLENGTGWKVASHRLVLPPVAPTRPILDGLLAEVTHGRGRALLCQLELIANLERTPAAGVLLARLLRQLAASEDPAPARPLWTNLPPGNQDLAPLFEGLGDAVIYADPAQTLANAGPTLGRVLFDLDPAAIAPFAKVMAHNQAELEQGSPPQPWSFNTWKAGSSARFESTVDEASGRSAIAFWNLEGKAGQLYWWKKPELQAGKRYLLTIEYLTTGSAGVKLTLQSPLVEDKQAGQELGGTNNAWQRWSHEIAADRTAEFGIKIQRWATGADDKLLIGSVVLAEVVDYGAGGTAAEAAPLPDGGVALVSFAPGATALPDAAAVDAFLASGGTLWLHALDRDAPSWVQALLPAGARLADPEVGLQQLELTPAAAATVPGLHLRDLLWNMGGGTFDQPVPIVDRVLEGAGFETIALEPHLTSRETTWHLNNVSVRPITTRGTGLARWDHGGGSVILDQLRWDAFAQYKRQALHIPRAICLGAGVRPAALGEPSGRGGGDFLHLDLAGVANRAVHDQTAGDGRGGWTDQGPTDFRDLPAGRQVLAEIPFRILGEDEAAGKRAVVLGGEATADHFPRTITIPINRPAKKLHFLHTCAYTPRDKGAEAFRYRIMDELLAEVAFTQRSGFEVVDWWDTRGSDELASPDARRVVLPTSGTQRSLTVSTWINPEPGRQVKQLTLEVLDPKAMAILIAITAEN